MSQIEIEVEKVEREPAAGMWQAAPAVTGILSEPSSSWVRMKNGDWPGDVRLWVEQDPETARWGVRELQVVNTWRPVIGADLRELNLDLLVHLAVEHARTGGSVTLARPKGSKRPGRRSPSSLPRLQRPEGRELTDAFLQHVAAAYTEARDNHLPVAEELARQVGDGCSHRTIHKWVYLARERDFLPKLERGTRANKRGRK